jgi:hypothetical protein
MVHHPKRMIIQRLLILLEATLKWFHSLFDMTVVQNKNLIMALQRMVLSLVQGFECLKKNGSQCNGQEKLRV